MERYKNLGGDSGVQSYEITDTSITVKFSGTSRTYTYSYNKAGEYHVENMKKLAIRGTGLNAYINYHVKFKYDM